MPGCGGRAPRIVNPPLHSAPSGAPRRPPAAPHSSSRAIGRGAGQDLAADRRIGRRRPRAARAAPSAAALARTSPPIAAPAAGGLSQLEPRHRRRRWPGPRRRSPRRPPASSRSSNRAIGRGAGPDLAADRPAGLNSRRETSANFDLREGRLSEASRLRGPTPEREGFREWRLSLARWVATTILVATCLAICSPARASLPRECACGLRRPP